MYYAKKVELILNSNSNTIIWWFRGCFAYRNNKASKQTIENWVEIICIYKVPKKPTHDAHIHPVWSCIGRILCTEYSVEKYIADKYVGYNS